jgi:hypothetical protein
VLEFTYVFLWLETCTSQLPRCRCQLNPEHEIRGNSGESKYEPALGGGGEGQRTDAIALPRKLAWASPYRRLFTASGQATKLEGLSATGAPRSSAGRRGRKLRNGTYESTVVPATKDERRRRTSLCESKNETSKQLPHTRSPSLRCGTRFCPLQRAFGILEQRLTDR